MKNILSILWALVFGCSNGYAQNNYYDKVNEAELHLMVYDFEAAVNSYDQIFQKDSLLYLKDVHNALVCAVKLSNSDLVRKFLRIMNRYDVDMDFYAQNSKFNFLNNYVDISKEFGSRMQSRGASNCDFYKRLSILDQSVRNACKSLSGDFYTLCRQEISVLDSINLNNLRLHFRTHGMLGDVGFCQVNPSLSPPYYLVLKHNLQWGRRDLDSLLYLGIDNNIFHPQWYSDLSEYYQQSYLMSKESMYGLGYNVRIDNRLFIFPIEAVLKEKINRARSEIHLEDIDLFHQKVIFQSKNPEFYLIYPGLLSSLDVEGELKQKFLADWTQYEVN